MGFNPYLMIAAFVLMAIAGYVMYRFSKE